MALSLPHPAGDALLGRGAAPSSALPSVPRLDHVCRPPAWLSPAFTLLSRQQRGAGGRRNCSASRLLVAGEPQDYSVSLAAALALGPDKAPTDVSPREGFASTLTSLSAALRLAAASERTLVLNMAGWAYGGDEQCSGALPPTVASWECVFEPLSDCTAYDAAAAQAEEARNAADAVVVDAAAVASRRYVRKDDLRAEIDAVTGRRVLRRFHAPVPAALRALGASGADWLAVIRAYLLAHATPGTRSALAAYGGPPPAPPDAANGLTIGLHIRTGDRGGGGGDLNATWARYAALTMRVAAASGARALLIATDDDNDAWLSAAAAALPVAPPAFRVRLLPRRVGRADSWQPMAEQLARSAPAIRADATLDALAAIDALGQCSFIVGRGDSTLLRLAASLSHARGCAGGGTDVPPTWSVGGVATAPGPIELEDGDEWGVEQTT